MVAYRSSTLTLIAAYLGLFVGLVDSNAVNLALPAIRGELGGGVSGAQWIVDAYNVTFAALLLTAGSLGDRFGRRRLLRAGLGTFLIASMACAATPTLPLLLAGRALQGVGAALILPQGLAIAAAAYPDDAGRARATAAWAMAAASSTAVGPILGGVLTDTVGWRYIFCLNAPVVLVALAMTFRYLPESRDPQPSAVDVPGQLLAVITLGVLTLTLVQGRTLPSSTITVLTVATVLCACAFSWSQRRSEQSMMPPDLCRNRRLIVALSATFAMTFGTYGLLMINSLAFQQLRGVSALATAMLFLPMPLTYLALIPVVNVVATRTGPRPPMVMGLLLMGAGMLLYASAGPQAELWLIEASFVLAGAGLAFNTGPAVALAMAATPETRTGLAAGLVNLARLVGITIGIALLGSVLAVVGPRTAVLTGAVVEWTGAMVVFVGIRPVAWKEAVEAQEVCRA